MTDEATRRCNSSSGSRSPGAISWSHTSQRMMIRVEQGKGREDRYVMVSPRRKNCCAPGAMRNL